MKLPSEEGVIKALLLIIKRRLFNLDSPTKLLIFFSKHLYLLISLISFLGVSSLSSLEQRADQVESETEVELALIDPIWEGGALFSDQGGVVKAPNIHFEAHCIQYTRQNKGKGHLLAKGGIYVNYFGSHLVGEELEFDFAAGSGILRLARVQVGIWTIGGSELHLMADGSYKIEHVWASTRVFPGITWRGSAEQIAVQSDRRIELSALTLKIGDQKVASFPHFQTKVETLEHFPLSLSFQMGSKRARKLGLCYTQIGLNHRSFFQLDRWFTGDWGGGLRLESRKKSSDWSTSHYFMRDQENRKKYHFVCNARAVYHWPQHNNRLTFQVSRSSNSHFSDRLGNLRLYKPHRSTYVAYRHQWASCAINTRALIKINPFETRKQELPSLQLFPKVQVWDKWHFNQSFESANLNLSFAKKSHQRPFSAWRSLWNGEIYRHQKVADFLTATAIVGARGYSVSCKSNDRSCQWLVPRWEGHLQMPLLAKARSLITTCNLFAHHIISPRPPRQYQRCYIFDLHESTTSNHEVSWGICGSLFYKMRLFLDYNICFSDPVGSLGKPQLRRCLLDMTWHLTPKFECDLRSWINRTDGRFDRTMLRFRATLNEKLAALIEYDKRHTKSWRGIGDHRDWLYKWHSESDLLASDLSDRRQYISGTIYWLVDPDLAIKWQARRGFDRAISGKSRRQSYSEWGLGAVAIIPGQWKMQFCYENRMGRRGLRRYLIELVNNSQVPIVTKPNF